MDKFPGNELEAFLRAVDTELAVETTIVMVGGAVIGLLCNPLRATADIDLVELAPPDLLAACERVRKVTGLMVEVSDRARGVIQAPESFMERLTPYGAGYFTKLRVLIPEWHDLTIMKLARGDEHDLQGIEDIHRAFPLSLPVLVERFRETYFTGPESRWRTQFVMLVERLFGPDEAERIDALLAPPTA